MYNSSKKGAVDTGIQYTAYRDLDHTNPAVQQGICSWMNTVLKRAGFVGWRYDFVKGFGGKYVGYYNAMSDAAFSVGEYWPDNGDWETQIGDWIASTAETVNGVAGKQSRAFDFVLKQKMNYAFGWTKSGSDVYEDGVTPSGDYWNMALLAETSSLMRSNPSAAVTFVDNHDTGSTQQHWELSWFDVPAAYAFILTHPGMPCVASQHYFVAGEDFVGWQYRGGETVDGTENTMRQHIDYLIELREDVGIEYDDTVEVLEATATNYAAKIAGTKGEIVVKIGGDMSWAPTGTGYDGNYPIYSGTNFAIWQSGKKGVIPPVIDTVYLKPNGDWKDANAWFAAYFFDHETDAAAKFVKMTDTDGDGIYECKILEGYASVLFTRNDPAKTDLDWPSAWNQTGDLTVPTTTKNCFTITGWKDGKGDGAWGTK